MHSQYSITEVEILLRVSALERINKRVTYKAHGKILNQNQNLYSLNLFEF